MPASAIERDGDKIFDAFEARLSKAAPEDRLKVIVTLASKVTAARVSALEQVVGPLAVTGRFEVIDAFAARATPSQVAVLARQASVVRVEENAVVRAFNDTAQASFGVTKAREDAPGLDGDRDGNPDVYSADDLVAAVIDTGIHAAHADLDEGKVLAFVDCRGGTCAPTAPFDDNGHGTHVAGTLAGDGDARVDRQYRGVAPAAALVGLKVLNANGVGNAADIAAAIDWVVANRAIYGIEAINLSVGIAGCGFSDGLDATSLAVNAAHAAGLVVAVAAGNSGPEACTIGSPAGATGALTVGAMADLHAAEAYGYSGPGFAQAMFSSRGPTMDGRVKPDITAPGVGITSAAAATTTGYNTFSGTSMASPFVAGVALLMLDADPTLTSQRVKDAIVATAVDWGRGGDNRTLGTTGTDIDYGAGRLDAYAALDRVHDPLVTLGTPPAAPVHALLQGTLAGPGDEAEFRLTAPDLGFPIAATLVMPDWAGGEPDFDLELLAPDGELLASGEATLRQEEFGVGGTQTGAYTLRVRSFSGAGSFFVDVSGAVPVAPAPSIRHNRALVDDAVHLGGDGDGVLEPGEGFVLNERLRNLGAAAATGVVGTLTSQTSGLTLTQPASDYGTITAGATATNATPFGGTLAGDAPCGAPVRMSLALTTGQGPFTVPVVIPTGVGAFPVSRSVTTPSDIPDEGSVDSTIVVPVPGTVKDVDVRMGQLTHTWVADLTIELISPAGTSVLLVDRRGGSADDFVGTVLDDEADEKVAGASAPFTGRLRPEKPLAAFDGENQQGTWTLRVTDHVEFDTGTLESWGTDTAVASCILDEDAAPPAPPAPDGQAPTDPIVRSTSHTVGVASADRTVDLAWSGAADGGSGVDGFSFSWDTQPASLPDTVKDAEETASGTTSPALSNGSWYFHLRTRDNAGNWTATRHVGPFVIAVRAPLQARCSVPRLKGKTLVQARRLLQAGRCGLGAVRRAYSVKVPKGRVIAQSRKPGLRLQRGAKVGVVVSRGRRR